MKKLLAIFLLLSSCKMSSKTYLEKYSDFNYLIHVFNEDGEYICSEKVHYIRRPVANPNSFTYSFEKVLVKKTTNNGSKIVTRVVHFEWPRNLIKIDTLKN